MKIHEIAKKTNLSKRAIKYYEECGLLEVKKDENGYRNYDEDDLQTLNKISFYRQLGIRIKDIKQLLKENDIALLEKVYKEKAKHIELLSLELEAIGHYIEHQDIEKALKEVDYQTVAQKIQGMIPGFYGYYFMHHFMPFLQIQITTNNQKVALQNIIDFWDNIEIKIPLLLRINAYVLYHFAPRHTIDQMVTQAQNAINSCLNLDDAGYEKLKKKTYSNVKFRNSFFVKNHPVFIAHRKLMKKLQDCGYNDLFISNLKVLSPTYKQYHDALLVVNQRLCQDLGLHYDSNYQLVTNKKA